MKFELYNTIFRLNEFIQQVFTGISSFCNILWNKQDTFCRKPIFLSVNCKYEATKDL